MGPQLSLNPAHVICLFTDGSAWTKDRSGGWAWVAFDWEDGYGESFGWAHDTTISRMELQAAIEGLNAIELACGPCEVLVYSDSEYVVLGATDRKRARRKNVDLWLALDAAIDQHEHVEFEHVRGHRDSTYNNRADELAGEARRAGQFDALDGQSDS